MDAEQIIRALAKQDPPGDFNDECSFCGGELERYFVVGYADTLEHHEADCPWRLAREWVAASEQPPRPPTYPRGKGPEDERSDQPAHYYQAVMELTDARRCEICGLGPSLHVF